MALPGGDALHSGAVTGQRPFHIEAMEWMRRVDELVDPYLGTAPEEPVPLDLAVLQRLQHELFDAWSDGTAYIRCNRNVEYSESDWRCPSVDASRLDPDRIGSTTNDMIMLHLLKMRLIARPALRAKPYPNEEEAISSYERFRRLLHQIGTDWEAATQEDDFEAAIDEAARVAVYYGSAGLTTVVPWRDLAELAKHEMTTENAAEVEERLAAMTPAQLQNYQQRVARLRAEVEREISEEQLRQDTRMRRVLLFEPRVYLALVGQYFYTVFYDKALTSVHTSLEREEAPPHPALLATVEQYLDRSLATTMIADYTLTTLSLYHALFRLGPCASDFVLRQNASLQRDQLVPFEVYCQHLSVCEQRELRAQLLAQVQCIEKRRPYLGGALSNAWDYVLWWRSFRMHCRYNFSSAHLLTRADLMASETEIFEGWRHGRPRAPLMVHAGSGWHVRIPGANPRAKSRFVWCRRGFRQALAVWLEASLAAPYHGSFEHGVDLSTPLRRAIGLISDAEVARARASGWGRSMGEYFTGRADLHRESLRWANPASEQTDEEAASTLAATDVDDRDLEASVFLPGDVPMPAELPPLDCVMEPPVTAPPPPPRYSLSFRAD